MVFVFIDESGDLGDKGSNFMVLAALIVSDPKRLNRALKNMRRHKFNKELKGVLEIKANKSSEKIIRHMLAELSRISYAKVIFVVLEKRRILSSFLKNDKNKLYNYVAGKLAKLLPSSSELIEIFVDKSKPLPILREDFDAYFIFNFRKNQSSAKLKILHSYSHNWAGIQFADCLAWACFQKFENKDSSFIDALKIEQEIHYVWN